MKTLLVFCVLKLADGSVQTLRGQEHVSKQRGDYIAVEFSNLGLKYVSENSCRYIDDPEDVSRRPELYYAKFQPDCGPEAHRLWTTTSLLTYKQACQMVAGLRK